VTDSNPPTAVPDTKSGSYSAALDGIRGTALLAVLAYHAGVPGIPGGLVGVDTFFVLSGFLITGLLLRERTKTGQISLGQFWARRARRLVPGLVVLLLIVAGYARWVAAPSQLGKIRTDALATLGYAANWRFAWSHQSYFDHFSAPSPLMHAWSLAVEEQFYLIWPIIVLLILRRRGGRAINTMFWVAVGGSLASATIMFLDSLHSVDPSRIYYGTDTRAQDLLVGAALACWRVNASRRVPNPRRRTHPKRNYVLLNIAALASAVAIGVVWAKVYGQATGLYRGGFFAVAVGSAIIIAAVIDQPKSILARLMSLWPLRYLGQISYGTYLYHWPIFLILNHQRTGLTGWSLVGLRIGVAVVAASLSYHFIENPIRYQKVRIPRPRLTIPTSVTALAVTLVVTTTGAAATSSEPANLSTAALQKFGDQNQQLAQQEAAAAVQHKEPAVSTSPKKMLFIGDSVALTLAGNAKLGGLVKIQGTYNADIINAGWVGCGIARNHIGFDGVKTFPAWSDCAQWDQEYRFLVDSLDPDVVTITLGMWEMIDRQVDGQWVNVLNSQSYRDYLSSELDLIINIAASKGARVALLSPPCYHNTEEAANGGTFLPNDPARLAAFKQLEVEAVDRHRDSTRLIDLEPLMCPGGTYTDKIDGVTTRMDDGIHPTPAGDYLMAPTLMPQFDALADEKGVDLRTLDSTPVPARNNRSTP
jgi:peptidoglycan/LPS O-acetylase OafA/YrhL